MMEPISYFKSFITDAVEELSNMVRLKKLMDENPQIQDGRECLRLTNGQVRLENVSFTYSESNEASIIVGNLSLTIKGGTKVAFVGPSSTGKSTIFKLVSQQLIPTEGRILIDSQDISAISKDS
jgi:ABC-type multidrug transport system fused ATPase/permease subunit